MKKSVITVLAVLSLLSCPPAGEPPSPAPPIAFGDPVQFPNHGPMVWDGANYAIAWGADDGAGPVVHFQQFSAAGTPIGSPLAVYEYGASFHFGYFIQLVWTGEEYAVFWRCGVKYSISMARISRDGQLAGGPYQITTPSRLSNTRLDYEVAWTGTEFGVAWYDKGPSDTVGGSVKLTRVGSGGSVVGELDYGHYEYFGGPNKPAIAGSGDGFAVCWVADISRLLAASTVGGGPNELANLSSTCMEIELVSVGADYGLIWTSATGDLSLLLLDSSCAAKGAAIVVNDMSSPSVIWTGQEFVMSACDYEIYTICASMWRWGDDIHFVRFDKTGTVLQDTCIDIAAEYPCLVWRNPGYAVGYWKELIDYQSCGTTGYTFALKESK